MKDFSNIGLILLRKSRLFLENIEGGLEKGCCDRFARYARILTFASFFPPQEAFFIANKICYVCGRV